MTKSENREQDPRKQLIMILGDYHPGVSCMTAHQGPPAPVTL
jgi:hypothetical protein